jgi:predicted methyltransferase
MGRITAALAAVAIVFAAGCASGEKTGAKPGEEALATAPALDAALQAALAGEWRSEANRARDAARHPAETMAFFGLKPGMTILEIAPGAGWWTEILAPYAKATGGRYIATGADLANPNLSEAAKTSRANFAARWAAQPEIFGTVELVNFGPQSGPLGPPASVDFVLTARNVHNFVPNGMTDKVFADVFAVLKPGGVFAVKDHRANPGAQDPQAASGYVTEAYVIAAAEKAGFRLAARSEINANPRDTKDHPFGVWTLPPVRRSAPQGQPANPAFDHTKYDAIGESDRMTLRFVKPG